MCLAYCRKRVPPPASPISVFLELVFGNSKATSISSALKPALYDKPQLEFQARSTRTISLARQTLGGVIILIDPCVQAHRSDRLCVG